VTGNSNKNSKWYSKYLGSFDVTEIYQDKPIATDLPQMLDFLKQWNSMAITLRVIHVLLGISATFFSLLAAAQIGSIEDVYVKIFAFLAAISIALMTAFNLGAKSNDTRTAWRKLNAAIMRYNIKVASLRQNEIANANEEKRRQKRK
jgi:hypothetical protein